MSLTQEQQRIVDNYDKNLLVEAGPGSGKSFSASKLSEKILQNPNNSIILLTFTNLAAKSITSKITSLDRSRLVSGTFHGVIYRAMRQQGLEFNICDENKKTILIKKVFGCRKDKERFEDIYHHISDSKSKYPVTLTDTINKYNLELAKYNLLDFDDIINVGTDLILENKLKLKCTHLIVDELQDTSQSQFELIKAIKSQTECLFQGIGDKFQSIYGFRGARYENIADCCNYFKCTKLTLGINFRSDKKIVEYSKKLIRSYNDDLVKNLRANSTKDGIVAIKRFNELYDELDYIVSLCKKFSREEIAIIYRNRQYKIKLEYLLRKNNIRYKLTDSLEIVDRSSFRTLLHTLKLATGSYDIYDMVEASKGLKKLAKGTLDKVSELLSNESILTLNNKLIELSTSNKKIKTGISTILELQQLFKKLDGKSLYEVIIKLPEYMISSFDISKDIFNFIKDLSRDYKVSVSDVKNMVNELGLDKEPEEDDANALISLTTSHASKGLEYDIVVVPFAQDYNPKDIKETEDERRVLYVAMTRARKQLYITYHGNKTQFISELEK